jgi:hypothetical protein
MGEKTKNSLIAKENLIKKISLESNLRTEALTYISIVTKYKVV